MSTLSFILSNARWLAAGFVLALGSCFGQTFFIGVFGASIREEFSLTDGDFRRSLYVRHAGERRRDYSARAVGGYHVRKTVGRDRHAWPCMRLYRHVHGFIMDNAVFRYLRASPVRPRLDEPPFRHLHGALV